LYFFSRIFFSEKITDAFPFFFPAYFLIKTNGCVVVVVVVIFFSRIFFNKN
jgi:hypothetical protein